MALLTVNAINDAVVKTKSERSLRYYLEHIAWPTIEPQTHFHGGWHIDAMCDHGQALIDNQIRNLLVTVPPRHTKSHHRQVALPSWAWAMFPELRFLYASFSADLSLEHAVLSRRVIQSSATSSSGARRVQLTSDQNVKSFYREQQARLPHLVALSVARSLAEVAIFSASMTRTTCRTLTSDMPASKSFGSTSTSGPDVSTIPRRADGWSSCSAATNPTWRRTLWRPRAKSGRI